MMNVLSVAIGGAIGATARYGLGLASAKVFVGSAFPIGTFLANILGGFLMGVLMGWILRETPDGAETIRLFGGVGILGGFTTFSAFSLEAMRMIEAKSYGLFFGYVSFSVLLAISAVALGLFIMRGAA